MHVSSSSYATYTTGLKASQLHAIKVQTEEQLAAATAYRDELQDKIEVHYAARVLLTCVANVCLGVVNVLLTP